MKIQALLLDSLAPLTSILEAHHKGDTLDQKEVIQAVRSGITLIGNANAHLLHLRRERVVGDINKALLPIVRDDSNFKEAAPLLFGTEFAKKSKEMVEQVKAMRSTITKKPERRPWFFRGGPPNNRGGLQPTIREGRSPKLPAERKAIPGGGEAKHKRELRTSSCVYKRNLSKYVDNPNGAHGRKTSSADRQPAAGRKIKEPHKHLEGDNERSVGVTDHSGLSGGLPSGTTAKSITSHSTILCGTESINSGGGKGTSGQRSYNRSAQPSGRVLLKPVPRPKKGRRTETSDKPKSSEQFGSHRAFQDGRNAHPQRPCQSGGLDGKGGSEGCLFCNPDPPVSPQIPEVQVPTQMLSVPVPTIWPDIGSLGLYQDPEASTSSPPGDGGAPDSIHR